MGRRATPTVPVSAHGSHLVRMARIVTMAAVAGLAAPASAAEHAAPSVTEDADEGLSPDARENLLAGASAFRHRNYRVAETRFARVARLAPDWMPIHYNRGVVAEAQGKVSEAIRSYERYLPHAPDSERALLEARLEDLERRRTALRGRYRRQVALGSLSLAAGLGLVGGGIAMLAIGFDRQNDEVFSTSSSSQALIGGGVTAVIAGAGVTFGLAMTLLLRARRTKRSLAFLPTASPRLVGGQLGWTF
jgi:tetratricopeptide (TPR) repeat protein